MNEEQDIKIKLIQMEPAKDGGYVISRMAYRQHEYLFAGNLAKCLAWLEKFYDEE